MTGFSIVIPAYNRSDLVRTCLSRFTGPDSAGIEVIVVDDGSTDDTPQLVESIAAASAGAEIRLVRQDNAGPGPARNRGAAEAQHDWVVFHDSDDIWMPWSIETLRQALDGVASNARVLFLGTERFTDEAKLGSWGRKALEYREHATLLDLRLDDPLPMIASCNVAFRRSEFLALGGYTDLVRHGEDTDLFFRAGELGPAGVIAAPVVVAYRTQAPGSQTNSGNAIRRQRTAFLLRRNREGHYPGLPEKRAQALSRTVAYTVRSYFGVGYVGPAYTVYAQGFGILLAGGRWSDALKLPLTPLLHYLKPGTYRFRWRPASASR